MDEQQYILYEVLMDKLHSKDRWQSVIESDFANLNSVQNKKKTI